MPRGARRRAPTVPDSLGRTGPRGAVPSSLLPASYTAPRRRRLPSSGSPGRQVIRERGTSTPGSDTAPVLPFAAMATATLTTKELGDLRTRLEEERDHLETQLASIVEESAAATQSDTAGDVGLDDEPADAGTATFEREKDLSIENNVRDLLRKIDGALRRMDAKTYGLCERCGRPIEKARLKALPYAELCIKDAQAAQSRR